MLVSTSAIFTENGASWSPYVMEYNGDDQSQNLECPLCCMLKYVKRDFMPI